VHVKRPLHSEITTDRQKLKSPVHKQRKDKGKGSTVKGKY
jgi:hypothetical protein